MQISQKQTENNQIYPDTWSQVINFVQNSHIQQGQKIKLQNIKRKHAYKKQLDKQVKEKAKQYVLQTSLKKLQRVQLDKEVIEEKIFANASKIKRIKTQQNYRAQNLSLMNQLNSSSVKLQRKYSQNPFVSLVDGQDQRKKQTKRSFNLQNKLNDIQIEIHQKKRQKQSKEQKQSLQKILIYQQKKYLKQKDEKQRLKQKYYKIKQCEDPCFISINSSLQKSYNQFLDHQIVQRKNRKKIQKQLDLSMKKINKYVEFPDSSPAYLGRIAHSYDRRKQLEILDKKLYEVQHRIDLYQPAKPTRSRSMLKQLQINNVSSQKILSLNHNTSKNQPLYKQIVIKFDQIKINPPKKQQKKSHNYIFYDLISGKKKKLNI